MNSTKTSKGYCMIKRIALLLCSVTLGACSNMANLHVTTQHIYNTKIITIKESAAPDVCGKYQPLPASATPDLPIDKIRLAADQSDHEVIFLLTKYIRELREYISREKKEELAHHQKYLSDCESTLK